MGWRLACQRPIVRKRKVNMCSWTSLFPAHMEPPDYVEFPDYIQGAGAVDGF